MPPFVVGNLTLARCGGRSRQADSRPEELLRRRRKSSLKISMFAWLLFDSGSDREQGGGLISGLRVSRSFYVSREAAKARSYGTACSRADGGPDAHRGRRDGPNRSVSGNWSCDGDWERWSPDRSTASEAERKRTF